MTKVSIIVPMFNEARHIERTLQAAARAARFSGLAHELIVVDNGSSDGGAAIAQRLGAKVLVVPGVTIGALRNRGAQASQGDWLAFLDADIEVPQNWLTVLMTLYRDGEGDVLALSCVAPGKAPWYARAWQRRTLPANDHLRDRNWLPAPNLLMLRSWHERVGGFDEQLRTGEDRDFTLRLRQAGARLRMARQPSVLHWGYEHSWSEWLRKELWRQGSHLQLLRQHGPNLRLLRFPLSSLALWVVDGSSLLALGAGHASQALLLLALGALPALALSLRQGFRQGDSLLLLQLWGLHWIRLHLAGGALALSLFNLQTRRPARG